MKAVGNIAKSRRRDVWSSIEGASPSIAGSMASKPQSPLAQERESFSKHHASRNIHRLEAMEMLLLLLLLGEFTSPEVNYEFV